MAAAFVVAEDVEFARCCSVVLAAAFVAALQTAVGEIEFARFAAEETESALEMMVEDLQHSHLFRTSPSESPSRSGIWKKEDRMNTLINRIVEYVEQ